VVEGKSLHSLRHTFAARTLLAQKNPYLVKTLLGHQSITTTEIYLQFPEGYLKDILSEEYPLLQTTPGIA
jgi:integrase/recombinase XerD